MSMTCHRGSIIKRARLVETFVRSIIKCAWVQHCLKCDHSMVEFLNMEFGELGSCLIMEFGYNFFPSASAVTSDNAIFVVRASYINRTEIELPVVVDSYFPFLRF